MHEKLPSMQKSLLKTWATSCQIQGPFQVPGKSL